MNSKIHVIDQGNGKRGFLTEKGIKTAEGELGQREQ